ncbi:hypothetical protein LT85_2473 [Collimonas arenae]|uniref:Uncharacterized protein n=1 Tax=Collimonas arenae TaxID=279058 RepID=A0A0A1FAR7_9BURK|nr:hypothetical protein LT85_2473 [Collimonas arenae]
MTWQNVLFVFRNLPIFTGEAFHRTASECAGIVQGNAGQQRISL